MRWTFQSLIDAGVELRAHCARCGHTVKLELVRWREMHGPDASAMASDLSPKVRCPKCKGRSIGFSYGMPSTSLEP